MHAYLEAISGGRALGGDEAEAAMHLLMNGEARAELVAAFLMGLRARGETLNELVAFTRVMRKYAVSVESGDPEAVDLCGTGGDGSGTFNISTASSLVCAGAGVTVAKHGNRSVSSSCGSADVLEALGVRVELPKAGVEYCFEKAGIAFMYAPLFHPAMKHVMPVRRMLGVRTFFNILGPLCNPAGVRRQLVGAFNLETARTMASVLERLEARHVMAVHSADGLDEVSLSDRTDVFEFASDGTDETGFGATVDGDKDGAGAGNEDSVDVKRGVGRRAENGISRRQIRPEDFGLRRTSLAALAGGTALENARIVRAILDGEPGPARDVVVLNAACALQTSGRFDGADECLDAAKQSIDSGRAKESLERLLTASNDAPTS